MKEKAVSWYNKKQKCEKKINCKGYKEELSLGMPIAELPERRVLEAFAEV